MNYHVDVQLYLNQILFRYEHYSFLMLRNLGGRFLNKNNHYLYVLMLFIYYLLAEISYIQGKTRAHISILNKTKINPRLQNQTELFYLHFMEAVGKSFSVLYNR